MTHEQTDDFLEHFGVKGMKWGQRKAEGSGPSVRSANRAAVKTLKTADRNAAKSAIVRQKAKENLQIDQARARFKSGAARKDYLDAKAGVKSTQRGTPERYIAKKNLKAVRQKNMSDQEIASRVKHGKETTDKILNDLGRELAAAVVLSSRHR